MALDSRETKNTSTPKTQAHAASGSVARSSTQSASQGANKSVAVVGGSAAGLLTASVLARQGVGVRVYERIETLEPAERTLIVTNRMRTLLGRAAEGSIVNEIRRFELFTDGRSATFELKQPDLIIERRALIQGLADEARRAGAGLELARRVARAAGWSPLETAPLVQAIVPLPKDMAPDTARVWFVPQDTPYFYWLIPESPTRGALGLIGETGPETRILLENFLEKRGLTPVEFQGARIPVYTGWVPVRRRVGHGSVYLVGDAAAQVKVTTVGGIVTGFRGALGVAEAILNGGSSSVLRKLRRELDLHLLLRRSLHEFQQDDYSKLVDLLNDPAKQSLSEYSRDEAWKILWRVCLSQPRLILLGLRGLLTHSRSLRGLRRSSV